MTTLAERIKAAREAAGLTQDQLGRAAGVTQQAIGKLEAGKVSESAALLKIARATGTDPYWLETGNGSMYEASRKAPEPIVSASPSDADERLDIIRAVLDAPAEQLDAVRVDLGLKYGETTASKATPPPEKGYKTTS